MLVLGAVAVVLLVGSGLLLTAGSPNPPPKSSDAPAPSSGTTPQPQSAPAGVGEKPPDLGSLAQGGTLAVVAAAGALAGGAMADVIDPSHSKPVTGAVAPIVGGAAAASAFLAFGGVIAGAAPPLTLVVLPALVFTAAVLGWVSAFEGQAQMDARRAGEAAYVQRTSKLVDERNALRAKGDYWGAWRLVELAAAEGIDLRWNNPNGYELAETVPLRQQQTTIDGHLVQAINVKAQLEHYYKNMPQAEADEWARALSLAQPWLAPSACRDYATTQGWRRVTAVERAEAAADEALANEANPARQSQQDRLKALAAKRAAEQAELDRLAAEKARIEATVAAGQIQTLTTTEKARYAGF